MATVWRARDERLRREVALKLLDVHQDEDLFYFHREARAAAALSHKNIVPIHDYSGMGEVPPWLVMELITGETLDELVAQRGPLKTWAVATIGIGVAAALAHAHENGVVHRDVKPDNVLVAHDGRVMLTDFGIAKSYDDPERLGATSVSDVTRLSGTPAFMSPEQITGQTVGPPCDVFALGSLLYYAITTASPFAAADLNDVAQRVAKVRYAPLAEGIDQTLRDLVHQCLAPRPEARPSAAQVLSALSKLLVQLAVVQPDVALAALARGEEQQTVIATSKIKQETPPPAPMEAPRTKSFALMAAVWAGAALVTIAGVYWALRPAPPPPEIVVRAPPPPAPVVVPAVPPAIPPPVTPSAPPPIPKDVPPPEDKRPEPPRQKPRHEEGAGTIEIIVIPWGKVTLDGDERGLTPAVREVTVASGRHSLLVEHPAFGKRRKTIDVRVGHRTTVEVDFTAE